VKTNQSGSNSITFFTMGYQSHTVPTLLRTLRKHEVLVLVDVRQNPVSRKPGFSKRRLEKTVCASGIEYIHLPSLGTPKQIRSIYTRTGNIQKALQQYELYLRSKSKCLRALLDRVTLRHFCLLCLESDYNSCHRSIIAAKLSEMTGCQPIHLT
jgi:uncharacterized protein (DUF488 family)